MLGVRNRQPRHFRACTGYAPIPGAARRPVGVCSGPGSRRVPRTAIRTRATSRALPLGRVRPFPRPRHPHHRRGPDHCLDRCASGAVASISSGTPATAPSRTQRAATWTGRPRAAEQDCCHLRSRSGRSRGASKRSGVAELADLERPHDVDGARHHRPDADEHEQCVGARQEELPAHPEAQRQHEDATDQGQPP
jgi:hypothetical protein